MDTLAAGGQAVADEAGHLAGGFRSHWDVDGDCGIFNILLRHNDSYGK